MDTILFSLLILGGLCDSKGRVWRCHPNQLYAIEITLPSMKHYSAQKDKESIPDISTLAFLQLLPTVVCSSPTRKAVDNLTIKGMGELIGASLSRPDTSKSSLLLLFIHSNSVPE